MKTQVYSADGGNSIWVYSHQSPATIAEKIAERDISDLTRLPSDVPYFLGLPTGRTPIPFLGSFVSQIVSLDSSYQAAVARKLRIVVMDDLVDIVTGENISIRLEFSALGFMNKHLLQLLNRFSVQLSEDSILYPKPGRVSELKKFIVDAGGIAMQMIATDPFEGHVAQNFPSQPIRKTEAQKFAPLSADFLRHNPWASGYSGVTFDMIDFSEMVQAHPSGKLIIVVCGAEKVNTLSRFLHDRLPTTDFPLSFFWNCEVPTELHTDLQDITEPIPELTA